MAERPADSLEWASNPPPGSIVAPTAGQRTDGWTLVDLPRGEQDNWFKELAYRWVDWLDQSLRGFVGALLENERAIAGGTPPVVAAGLTLAPGAFSATIVYDGNQVQADSPVVNMIASRRYYADLSVDGVWTIIETTLVAAPPALTADSVRVYVWTTDGAGIDDIDDNRPARTAARGSALSFTGSLEVGAERPDADPALVIPALSVGNEWSQLFAYVDGRVGGEYVSVLSSARRMSLIGALFVGGATPWLAVTSTLVRTERDGGQLRTWRVAGLTPGDSYSNTIFGNTPPVGVTCDYRTDTHGIRHMAATGFSGAPDVAPTPALEIDRSNTTAELVPVLVAPGVREYVGADVFGLGPGRVFVANAEWDEANARWVRLSAGDASATVLARAGGVRTYYRLSGEASPWVTADWHLTMRQNDRAASSVTVEAPRIELTADPGGTMVTNTLYRQGIPRAWGVISADGAGDVQLEQGYGVQAVAWNAGTGSIDVELRLPMASNRFAVLANFLGGAGTDPLRISNPIPGTAAGGAGGGATFSIQTSSLPAGTVSNMTSGGAGASPVAFVVFGNQ